MLFQRKLQLGYRAERKIEFDTVRTLRFPREPDRNQSQDHWFSFRFHFSFWLPRRKRAEAVPIFSIIQSSALLCGFDAFSDEISLKPENSELPLYTPD